jgi:hypothetical protein
VNDSRGVAFAHHDDLQKPAAGVGADDEQPGLAVVLLFDVAERDMHCVSDIVVGDAVFFVVLPCAITDLHSVKIPLRRWLRQGWWCWRRSLPLRSGDASSPVSSRRIRRRFALAWISPRRGRNRGLTRKWSPEQISARLVVSHPDDPAVRVSHERIYQTFYCRPAVSCDPS